jgi:hypothetical protein
MSSDFAADVLNPPVKTGSEILAGKGSVFSKKPKTGKITKK